MEEWKEIEGFPGYRVSNLGNVIGKRKPLIPGLDTDGYQQVNVYNGGKRHCKKVHRLVLEAFIPNNENKVCIDHVNRNRVDNRLENLRWATQQENCWNRGRPEDMEGITWNKKNSTYVIKLRLNNREQYIGSRKSLEDARNLRDESIALGRNPKVAMQDRPMYGITFLKKTQTYELKIRRNKILTRRYANTLEEIIAIRDSILKSKDTTIDNEVS